MYPIRALLHCGIARNRTSPRMGFEISRRAFWGSTRPNRISSVTQTRTSIRKRPRSRDDRYGQILNKIYARVPWMRFARRGVDLRGKTTRSRVVVRDTLPFGRVVLQEVHDQNDPSQDPKNPNVRSRWGAVRCGRLTVTNLSTEARDSILYKEFDAIWQGENVVLLDGEFDIEPRLGARPKPSSDLPPLKEAIAVTPLGWQGSRLTLQNKNVRRELQFLETFERDPRTEVLKYIEKRSYILVWDNRRWNRAQVKDTESSVGSMLVTFIDEGVDKTVPKNEELLGIAPTTWLQPPAGAIHIDMPEYRGKQWDIQSYTNEEMFCVLHKPLGNTKYAGELFVKSKGGQLIDISRPVGRIDAPSPQLGLCFVTHVEPAAKKIHVVNAQRMDEYGTFLSEKLADINQKRQIYRVKEGQAVLALMSELLCRAEVSEIREDGILVKYIDYGNTGSVDKVFAIPDELVTIPALAFPISLDRGSESHFEFGKVLTITSIDGESVKFSRLES